MYADMRVHVCKCVVCPIPIQEGCILVLIELRNAAFGAAWSVLSCEGKLNLETRKIDQSLPTNWPSKR